MQTPNIGQSVTTIDNNSNLLITSTLSKYASLSSELSHTGQNIMSKVSHVAQTHKFISQEQYNIFCYRINIAFNQLFGLANMPIDYFLQLITRLDFRDILSEKIKNSTDLSIEVKNRLVSWHGIAKGESPRQKFFLEKIDLMSLRTVLAVYFLNRYVIKDGHLYFNQLDVKRACNMQICYVSAALCIAPLAWEKYSQEVKETLSHLKITAIEKSLNQANFHFIGASDNCVQTPNIGQSVKGIGNNSDSLAAPILLKCALPSSGSSHTEQNIAFAVSQVSQTHGFISQAKYNNFRAKFNIAFGRLFGLTNLPIDDFLQLIIKLELGGILSEIMGLSNFSNDVKHILKNWYKIAERDLLRPRYPAKNRDLISLKVLLALYFLDRYIFKDGRLSFTHAKAVEACNMGGHYVGAGMRVAPLAWEKYSQEVEKTLSHLNLNAEDLIKIKQVRSEPIKQKRIY